MGDRGDRGDRGDGGDEGDSSNVKVEPLRVEVEPLSKWVKLNIKPHPASGFPLLTKERD
ncbi:hypothetical protein [Nostoc sp.]